MTSSRLPRTLGLWNGIALVVGITIGSGIFRSPAGIAQKVPSPTLMLALWVVGGLVTLCGALSLAELAAALRHPQEPLATQPLAPPASDGATVSVVRSRATTS